MRPTVAALALSLLSTATLTVPAQAGDAIPPISDPTVLKECGACHMAYQPQFLSAQAWTKILGDLPHHFGEDAGLPDATRAKILAFYTANAGRSQAGLTRITQQSWWLQEHRAVGQSRFAEAKSRANCLACHKTADKGVYENDLGR